MSLWLKRKDSEGRTHLYAIPFASLLILPLIGLLVALLVPLMQAIRAWLGG